MAGLANPFDLTDFLDLILQNCTLDLFQDQFPLGKV
ncbi:hypothetical protein J2X53_004249 [Pseudorhodobacter sp. 4114]|nr:hypothetical protein [Pseudorhodobacter sp. 4114]